MRKPTVFLSIPGAFAVANLLRSEFFPALRQAGLHIVLLTPYASEPSFVAEFGRLGKVNVEELIEARQTPGEARFRRMAYLSLSRRHPNRSTPIFRDYMVRQASASGWRHLWNHHAKEAIAPVLPPRIWLQLADRASGPPVYEDLFERYHPELVLTAAQGVMYANEVPLLRESLAHNVPVLAIHMSWDHLSSKREAGYRVSGLVVWNDFMKRDAIERFGYREDEVYVAGVPHWDLYAQRDLLQSRAAFFRKLGLDPARKLIVLTTASERIYPSHDHVIKTLLGAIAGDALNLPSQLLVRLHPLQSPDDCMDFSGLPGVFVEYPAGRFENTKFASRANITLDDRQHLMNTLFHADVVVNYASSITIEACIFDTPVVNIAYDGEKSSFFYGSALAGYYQEHYSRLVETGGVRLVRSADELVYWVNQYLADPSLDHEGRKRIVQEQVGELDGKAARRTAKCVLAFLSRLRNSH